MTKKKQTKDEKLEERIEKILFILNQPETGCRFWKSDQPHSHIMGIRPINRTCKEVIGKDTFNPYDKITDEKLFKFFYIYISSKKEYIVPSIEEIEQKKEIENNGCIYKKHHDLFYIFDFIRNNK